jgi:hypothetical protein
MTRFPRTVLLLIIALSVAAPSVASAQGKSRGSSGGSSRGSGGTARSAPPSRPGSASPRAGASRPGTSSLPSRPSGTTVRPGSTSTKSTNSASRAGSTRDRGNRPGVGAATPRGDERNTRRLLIYPAPFYGGWGWDPWDSFGYGYGYGFGSRYGFGAFSRFGPYGYGSGAYGRGVGRLAAPRDRAGSIRLRVNPSSAQVYVDGALAGTVDEFNGLNEHLDLEAGTHELELRAAGFQTYQKQINVSVGKTMTERVTMKKNR